MIQLNKQYSLEVFFVPCAFMIEKNLKLTSLDSDCLWSYRMRWYDSFKEFMGRKKRRNNDCRVQPLKTNMASGLQRKSMGRRYQQLFLGR